VNGYTPCFIAAEKGHIAIVDILRAQGANLEIIDKVKFYSCFAVFSELKILIFY
jgi:hypothetical protein